MHNYAVLQQKKGNYKLAAEWFDKAGLDASKRNIKAMQECGQIKEDLNLVVANDRHIDGYYGPIMSAVYGTEVDTIHLHSFGGNTTTCDINPSVLPGAKHLIADALTFDFAKMYNLKHVLIERLPTIRPINPSLGLGSGPITMDEGIKGGFDRNAKIEWDPYITQSEHTREECEEYHIRNPFHGFINIDAAVLGVRCMDPHLDLDWVPQELHTTAQEYGGKFRAEVEYWHAQGAGSSVQEISDRMNAEVDLFVKLMSPLASNKPALLAFVEADILKDPTEKVIAAMKNAVLGQFSPELIGKPCQMPDGRKGRLYDTGSLVEDSLYSLTIKSLCVQNNMSYAKRNLESIAIKDVVVERRTNTHNGRKNVWMVWAVKA
eukprot:gene10881-12697_t